MRNLLLSGLLLPLKLYFQPYKFRAEVAALAPDLPDNYSLWQARHKWREANFRYALGRLTAQTLMSQLWPVLICLILQFLGVEINWFGVAGGVAMGVAWGVIAGVAWGVAGGVVAGVVGSVACGVVGGVVGSLAWSVIMGMALGVAVGVAFVVMFGVVVGVAVGVALGVALGVAGSGALGVAGSGAVGGASVVITTHLLNLPIEWLQSLISAVVARIAPRKSLALWRISPVRWDEVILLPLPGLVTSLASLIREYPAEGQQALKEVAAHPYQRRAAHQVLVRLAQEDAQQVTTLPELGAYERSLNWWSESDLLPQASRQALLKMRDVSREVASAQESDSATNRVRRLDVAQATLETLRANPGEFDAVLATWSQLVTGALASAHRQQQIYEPILQVYANDGKAIWPGNRRDEELPFKGRKSLITQLELALGGQAGERSTVLLYGQRRTGKTSLLLQLSRRLGSQFVPVFVDLQAGKFGAKEAAGLLGGLADTVADEALAKRSVNLPRVDRRALDKDPYPAWDAWLAEVETALNQRTLLLCLDEFEALEEAIAAERIDARLLNMLRSVTQHRHTICVLLSGSHQIDELPPHWARALVGTSVLPISFLDEADARELIERPVKDFPDIYSREAVDAIVRVTHCQPYYIQLLCGLLVERMNEARRMPPDSCVAADDVAAIIPLALVRGQNYFSDLWQNQIGSEAGRRILKHLAYSPDLQLSLSDIRALVPDDIARRAAIDTLKRREIIAMTDGGCRIIVPLVAAYVRQRTMV